MFAYGPFSEKSEFDRPAIWQTHRARPGGEYRQQDGEGGPRAALGLTYVDGICVEMIQTNTLRSNNTSGATGVEWVPATNRWKAVIFFKGRRYYLGSYKRFEDAVKARKQGEGEYHDKFVEEFTSLEQGLQTVGATVGNDEGAQ